VQTIFLNDFDLELGDLKGFTPVCVSVQTMFLNDFDLELGDLKGFAFGGLPNSDFNNY